MRKSKESYGVGGIAGKDDNASGIKVVGGLDFDDEEEIEVEEEEEEEYDEEDEEASSINQS